MPPQSDPPPCRNAATRKFLVRHGDIATHIAVLAEAAREGGKLLGRQILELVHAGDAELLAPVVVDHRRARVRHRMAHQARPSQLGHSQSGEKAVDFKIRHSWLWCAPSSRLLTRYAWNAGSAISASRFFSRSAWLAYFQTCTTWLSGPTSAVA